MQVIIWEVAAIRTVVRTLTLPSALPGHRAILHLAWSANSRILFACTAGGLILCWDVERGLIARCFKAPVAGVRSLKPHPTVTTLLLLIPSSGMPWVLDWAAVPTSSVAASASSGHSGSSSASADDSASSSASNNSRSSDSTTEGWAWRLPECLLPPPRPPVKSTRTGMAAQSSAAAASANNSSASSSSYSVVTGAMLGSISTIGGGGGGGPIPKQFRGEGLRCDGCWHSSDGRLLYLATTRSDLVLLRLSTVDERMAALERSATSASISGATSASADGGIGQVSSSSSSSQPSLPSPRLAVHRLAYVSTGPALPVPEIRHYAAVSPNGDAVMQSGSRSSNGSSSSVTGWDPYSSEPHGMLLVSTKSGIVLHNDGCNDLSILPAEESDTDDEDDEDDGDEDGEESAGENEGASETKPAEISERSASPSVAGAAGTASGSSAADPSSSSPPVLAPINLSEVGRRYSDRINNTPFGLARLCPKGQHILSLPLSDSGHYTGQLLVFRRGDLGTFTLRSGPLGGLVRFEVHPTRFVVAGISARGGLHLLQQPFRTHFYPGPMYPVGYQLITANKGASFLRHRPVPDFNGWR